MSSKSPVLRIALAVLTVVFLSIGVGHASGPVAPANSVRGAVYVPYGAYNAPQMWKNFNLKETKRDFGYARELHLNALRIWASYEYWKMDPVQFQQSFDEMLGAAHSAGIRVLISLFENDGVPPTQENMWATDPRTAYCIQSPGQEIAEGGGKQWDGPRAYLRWFMKTYANDGRLIGIEVMNEPRGGTLPFAKSMFATAREMHGTVPLTIGAGKLETAEEFLPLGAGIIEFHHNYPVSLDELDGRIVAGLAAGQKAGVPVWLTEWQRLRPHGNGWGKKPVDPAELQIDYSSLADNVRKYPIGNFFWSLMVKPAYLQKQRVKGTVSGIFWPDGSVASLKDARAIANDRSLVLKEKPIPVDYLTTLQAGR